MTDAEASQKLRELAGIAASVAFYLEAAANVTDDPRTPPTSARRWLPWWCMARVKIADLMEQSGWRSEQTKESAE